MKIILSPAKSLNLKNPVDKDWNINEHTKKIADVLREKSGEELKQILKISDKLVDENLAYINNFDKKTSYHAVEMYYGMAYKVLDISSLNESALAYVQEHLFILSAFYGILKPYEFIKPYRLDFNSKLKMEGQSLKNYWKDYYNSYIQEGETVFNLASNEFSDLFDKSKFNWIDFDFFELKDGIKKRHSTIAKKGRGRLLRELAEQNIQSLEDVKKLAGYGKYFVIDICHK